MGACETSALCESDALPCPTGSGKTNRMRAAFAGRAALLKAIFPQSIDGCDLLVPPRREHLDLLEAQDRWFAVSDNCRPPSFLGWQYHCSQHCRAEFHRAVICEGDGLVRSKAIVYAYATASC